MAEPLLLVSGRAAARLMRYVELNPVRAGIATDAGEYEWSSARAHVGGAVVDGGRVAGGELCPAAVRVRGIYVKGLEERGSGDLWQAAEA